ncbi:MAG TPA: DUF1573 domain-containing protein [Candidatus Angelobacter sp.]|nr:DUF1573 domain-containing protein [Candidatus Angelobacter sp.]
MFLFKRMIFAGAATLLSLALFAGCRSLETKPQPGEPVAPVVTNTNRPAPRHVKQPPESGDTMAPHILAWNRLSEEYHAKPGEMIAPFSFSLTNVSKGPVVIYDTATTCDCTVAKLPSTPWTIPSGGTGKIEATIDLTHKTGVVTNSIVVFTSKGNRRLYVKAFKP